MGDDASWKQDNSWVLILRAYPVWMPMFRNYCIWTSIPLFAPSSRDQPRFIVEAILIYMWSRFRSIQSHQDVFFGLKGERLQSAPECTKVSICFDLLSPKEILKLENYVFVLQESMRGCLAFAAWSHLLSLYATRIFWSLEVTPTNEFGMNQIGLNLAGVCTVRI